ncbi:hypothetical protein [Pseudanabaena sp. ABRG5-3]|nr:hypothetical protein [Pseudanabaena sp. ABRG5-3]
MVCGSAPLRDVLPQTQKPTNDLGLLYCDRYSHQPINKQQEIAN